MKSYFQKMPFLGKGLKDQQNATEVENIRNIFEVEGRIDEAVEKAKRRISC